MNVLEVGAEYPTLVASSNFEKERLPPSWFGPVGPRDTSAEERIGDGLVRIEGEVDLVGFDSGEEVGEVGVFNGR